MSSKKEKWFKSDQFLTEISTAEEFRVRAFGFWIWKRYYLEARYTFHKKEWSYFYVGYVGTTTKVKWKKIGIYKTPEKASEGLEEVMDLLGMYHEPV